MATLCWIASNPSRSLSICFFRCCAHHLLVGRAEHEDHAATDLLVAFRVNQLVLQHRQFVVLARQRTVGLAAALLFYRQKTGFLPGQRLAMPVEQRRKLAHGAQMA